MNEYKPEELEIHDENMNLPAQTPEIFSLLPRIIVTHYPPNFEPCRSTWESYLASCLTGLSFGASGGFEVSLAPRLMFRVLKFRKLNL